jgi:hypothetical protein
MGENTDSLLKCQPPLPRSRSKDDRSEAIGRQEEEAVALRLSQSGDPEQETFKIIIIYIYIN